MNGIPMLGMIIAGKAPKGRKDPVKKRAKTGEKPESQTGQQHGELPADVEPTPAQRMKDNARESKVRATRDWVDGHIDSKKHAAIHKRADHVLTDKAPARKLPKGW